VKVVGIGSFQITKDKEDTTILSPLSGIAAVIIGRVVFLFGNKRHFRQG